MNSLRDVDAEDAILRQLGQSLHPALTIARCKSLAFSVNHEYLLCLGGIIDNTDLMSLWHIPIDISCNDWAGALMQADGTLKHQHRLVFDQMLIVQDRLRKVVTHKELKGNVSISASGAKNRPYVAGPDGPDGPAKIILWACGSQYSLELLLGREPFHMYGYCGIGAPSVDVVTLEEWADAMVSIQTQWCKGRSNTTRIWFPKN